MPTASLARTCRDHQDYLRGFARRLATVDGDDLLQDAWLAALTGRPPDDEGELRAWLTTVIRHRHVDRCRRRAAAARLHAALPEPAEARADEPWWMSLSTDDVRAGVAALPPHLAAPFALFALERASYKTIAARLGIAPATVGTRILRARARLRAILAGRHGVTPAVT